MYFYFKSYKNSQVNKVMGSLIPETMAKLMEEML